jgi:hypothetical protein
MPQQCNKMKAFNGMQTTNRNAGYVPDIRELHDKEKRHSTPNIYASAL